jgi:hypothetical protein
MTLEKDDRRKRPEENRTQKIVMWSIFAVVIVLAIIAITILIVTGTPLF